MNLHDVLRKEVQRLHAHEVDVPPTLIRIGDRALSEGVRLIVDRMLDECPSRQGRLEVVLAISNWPTDPRPPGILQGWSQDVDELTNGYEPSAAQDATILLLLLKICRLRTAGYEAAYAMALVLDDKHVASLLAPLWLADRESDGLASTELAAIIGSGRWSATIKQTSNDVN